MISVHSFTMFCQNRFWKFGKSLSRPDRVNLQKLVHWSRHLQLPLTSLRRRCYLAVAQITASMIQYLDATTPESSTENPRYRFLDRKEEISLLPIEDRD